MTLSINHRPPAFDGFDNYKPVYFALTQQQRAQLSAFIGESFVAIEAMNSAYTFPCGFYRACFVDEDWTVFFKILPESFWEVECFAASVEGFLSSHNIAARDVQCKTFSVDRLSYFYCRMPYMSFDLIKADVKEAEILGRYLREVHACLQDFPKRDSVKQNWLKRKTRYLKSLGYAKILQEDSSLPTFMNKDLGLLTEHHYLLDFDLDFAQVVHGDLNPGNIVFNAKTSDEKYYPAMLIDYEISHFSFFPKEFDVAMLIQRLYFNRLNLPEAENLTEFFLKGYGQLDYDLKEAMRAVSLRSLLILLDRAVSGQPVKESEWQKFINLFCAVQDYNDVISHGNY